MVAGDVNRSTIITASDANDVFGQLNTAGYSFNDVNMSGIVSEADANSIFGNVNRASEVPSNTRQLPPTKHAQRIDAAK